jgi:hypothetical protein
VDPTAKSALPSFFSSFKYKKQLLVVWSDRYNSPPLARLRNITSLRFHPIGSRPHSKGAHTRTYGDTEPVFIQYA